MTRNSSTTSSPMSEGRSPSILVVHPPRIHLAHVRLPTKIAVSPGRAPPSGRTVPFRRRRRDRCPLHELAVPHQSSRPPVEIARTHLLPAERNRSTNERAIACWRIFGPSSIRRTTLRTWRGFTGFTKYSVTSAPSASRRVSSSSLLVTVPTRATAAVRPRTRAPHRAFQHLLVEEHESSKARRRRSSSASAAFHRHRDVEPSPSGTAGAIRGLGFVVDPEDGLWCGGMWRPAAVRRRRTAGGGQQNLPSSIRKSAVRIVGPCSVPRPTRSPLLHSRFAPSRRSRPKPRSARPPRNRARDMIAAQARRRRASAAVDARAALARGARRCRAGLAHVRSRSPRPSAPRSGN